MNNNKIYKNLYLICFYLTLAIIAFVMSFSYVLYIVLGFINLILFIISYKYLRNDKIKNINVLFPIVYIVFLVLVVIIAFMFNSKVFIYFMHFNYYSLFVLFNYLLLNIYTLLSIDKNAKK